MGKEIWTCSWYSHEETQSKVWPEVCFNTQITGWSLSLHTEICSLGWTVWVFAQPGLNWTAIGSNTWVWKVEWVNYVNILRKTSRLMTHPEGFCFVVPRAKNWSLVCHHQWKSRDPPPSNEISHWFKLPWASITVGLTTATENTPPQTVEHPWDGRQSKHCKA